MDCSGSGESLERLPSGGSKKSVGAGPADQPWFDAPLRRFVSSAKTPTTSPGGRHIRRPPLPSGIIRPREAAPPETQRPSTGVVFRRGAPPRPQHNRSSSGAGRKETMPLRRPSERSSGINRSRLYLQWIGKSKTCFYTSPLRVPIRLGQFYKRISQRPIFPVSFKSIFSFCVRYSERDCRRKVIKSTFPLYLEITWIFTPNHTLCRPPRQSNQRRWTFQATELVTDPVMDFPLLFLPIFVLWEKSFPKGPGDMEGIELKVQKEND